MNLSSLRFVSIAVLTVCGLLTATACDAAVEGAETGHNHAHSHGHEVGTHSPDDHVATVEPFDNWVLLGVYSIVIAAASLFGGWLPGHVRLTHVRFQTVMSVVGGLILGIGVLHLLPHAVYELGTGAVDVIAKWMLAGIVMMFFLLRAFHAHHHQPEVEQADDIEQPEAEGISVTKEHVHSLGEACRHDHDGHHHVGWMGILFGLAIHTLLDGLALGATMQAEAAHSASSLAGFGIMLAIALHKPLDSLSITTLMMSAGKPASTRWLVNLFYASLCPIGAACFLMGVGQLDSDGHFVVGCSLAFSAGVFLCIALADLLPEMEFHSHHRLRLTAALLLGIALAWGIQFLEPAHLHQ